MAKRNRGGNKFGQQPKRGGAGVLKNPKDANQPAKLGKYNKGRGGKKNPDRAPKPTRKYEMEDGSTYNSADYGKRGFGGADVKQLRAQGMADDKIRSMMRGGDKGNVQNSAYKALGDYDKGSEMESLSEFNPDRIQSRGQRRGTNPGTDVSRLEVKGLMEGGKFSAQEVNDYLKEEGLALRSGAQSFLNKRLQRATNNQPTDVTKEPGKPFIPTKPINEVQSSTAVTEQATVPPAGSNEDGTIQPSESTPTKMPGAPAQMLAATQEQNASQNINSGDKLNDNKFNNRNMTTFGNVNQNNDMSINIGGQNLNQQAANSMGGGASGGGQPVGAMGLGGGGNDNFASAAATMGLMENALKRSQSSMSGTGRAAQASAAAGQITGAKDRIAALNYYTEMNPRFMGAKSYNEVMNYLGDIKNPAFSANLPEFVSPESPKRPKGVDLDDIDDFTNFK